jgi:hypothetical protein
MLSHNFTIFEKQLCLTNNFGCWTLHQYTPNFHFTFVAVSSNYLKVGRPPKILRVPQTFSNLQRLTINAYAKLGYSHRGSHAILLRVFNNQLFKKIKLLQYLIELLT